VHCDGEQHDGEEDQHQDRDDDHSAEQAAPHDLQDRGDQSDAAAEFTATQADDLYELISQRTAEGRSIAITANRAPQDVSAHAVRVSDRRRFRRRKISARRIVGGLGHDGFS
jgi:hypothetical protein